MKAKRCVIADVKTLSLNQKGYDSLSYAEIVQGFGVEVLTYESLGDYQGDLLFLLRDEGRYGFLVVGYGSCSGCDALEACHNNDAELQGLADRLFESITWRDNGNEMTGYLSSLEEGEHYWLGHPGSRQAVGQIIAKIV